MIVDLIPRFIPFLSKVEVIKMKKNAQLHMCCNAVKDYMCSEIPFLSKAEVIKMKQKTQIRMC